MSKASSILCRVVAILAVLLAVVVIEAAEIVLPRLATPLSDSASGPSGGAAMSTDGRYVAFTSAADNLHSGSPGSSAIQVYVRDRQIEAKMIVSINTNGVPGNGNSHSPAISSDGKLVVFQSEASDLVAGDTNGVSDIFLRDIASGEMKLISQPIAGTAGNGPSRTPLFNSDATLVIFESFATNLVAVTDTNRAWDIFIRDLAAGTNGLVTFRKGSADAANRGSTLGEVVAGAPRIFFKSEATNLAEATTSEQWFVHDWGMRTNILVSRGSLNATVYPVYGGALSRDGQMVTFVGDARLAGPFQSSLRVFYRSVADPLLRSALVTNTTDLIYGNLALSPSGSRIAVGARSGVYVWDVPTFALRKIDLTNFLAEATIPPIELPAEDLLLVGGMGVHALVETNFFGGPFKVQAIGGLFFARAEGSGEVVVSDPDAPGADLNSAMDVFVAAEGGLISRAELNLREPTLEIEAHRQFTAAPNGQAIIFTSSSSRLNSSDTNGFADIYSWTPKNGELKLLTLGTNGAATGPSQFPTISRDGRWMAYWSAASNLVADTYRFHDVLIQDLTTGANELVTVPAVAATAATDFPSELAISANGRYVAFASKRKDLTEVTTYSWTRLFVRDRELATNIWMFDATNRVAQPLAIFEPLVWFWSRTNVFTYNLTNGVVNRVGVVSVVPVFSSDGSMAAFRFFNRTSGGTNLISLHNTASGETRVLLATSSNFNNLDRMSLSDNGRVAFVSNLQLLPEDDDQTNDVYVVTSEETPRLFLVSSMTNEPGMTARASAPVITANGERVYFRSSKADTEFQRWNDLFVTTLADGKVERITLANGARAHAVSKPLLLQHGVAALVDYNDHGLENPSAFAELVMIEYAPAAVDSDQDGLPDAWELANFQGLSESASGDFDHDGMTNGAEFFAGTNATEPGSVLSLEISTSVEGRRINFPKLPEKTAVIQYRQSLSEGDWIDLPGSSTETGEGMTAVDPENVTTRFYRLRLNP